MTSVRCGAPRLRSVFLAEDAAGTQGKPQICAWAFAIEVRVQCRILCLSRTHCLRSLSSGSRQRQPGPPLLLCASFGRWCGGAAVSLLQSKGRFCCCAFSIASSLRTSTRQLPESSCAPCRSPRSAWTASSRKASPSILSSPIALETLASVLRSDQIAWRVITGLKLYQAPGFRGQLCQPLPGLPSR